MDSLDRFIEAQEKSYSTALEEIKRGRKTSHWMWYVFPQIDGLGYSETAKYYAIKDLDEAKRYLDNKILNNRLREISDVLLTLNESNPINIFGFIDSTKLKSCMTLFDIISPNDIFQKVLDKYYNGEKDELTLQLVK